MKYEGDGDCNCIDAFRMDLNDLKRNGRNYFKQFGYYEYKFLFNTVKWLKQFYFKQFSLVKVCSLNTQLNAKTVHFNQFSSVITQFSST